MYKNHPTIRFAAILFVFAVVAVFVENRAQDITQPVENTEVPSTISKALATEVNEDLFPFVAKAGDVNGSADLITASTYSYSFLTGVALEDISSGSTLLVGGGADDTASAVTNIGFDFLYDGVRHSQFSVNVNGLARLGSTIVGTTFNNSTSGLDTVTNAPKIAPYFEDLCTGSTGGIRYKVVGSAPNRKLVVEWFGMEIPREGSCSVLPQTGVFQMWLFESAGSATPGRIQFVYGGGVNPSTATDLGASVGLQSGAATNFASVTVSDDTVSYVAANNTNLPGIAAGKSYIFTPANSPAAPSGLNFTGVTPTSQTLNWTDNSTNELAFGIFRSTDGINYSFVAQTAADAVSYTDTLLTPSTNYFYRVQAFAEGISSASLSGNSSTTAGGNISCAGAGGNWSDTAAWVGGVVPTANDNVTIPSGCTVTVDTATATALNLTIDSGGTVQSPLTGAVTTNNLTVIGNVTNNGTLDLSTNTDTSAAILTFGTGGFNTTFGGTGATTDVRSIVIAKGSQGILVEMNPTNFTVQGVNTDVAGFLTLTSGTFKISGTFTATNRVFTAAAYSIPAIGGFWLSNPNFTVAGQNGSPTNNGLLRVSNGTFNVGTSSGNSMGGGAGAVFTIEGGTSNFAGRLQTTSTVTYNQSGGAVNVSTVGNAAATASFGLTSTLNTFNMSGGSITIVVPSSNATPLDYSVSTSATVNFVTNPVNTVLNVGTGAAAETFRISGATPSLNIPANKTMAVGSGTAGAAIFHRGATVLNDGAIVVQGTGTSSRFDWAANGPMLYAGSGTFGTAATPFAGVGMSANSGNGSNTTINAPIFVNRVNFFSGGFTNSGLITLGGGAATATVVQVGNSTTPTNAGVFDVSPNFNTGTGGHILLYLRTTTLNRVTGFEIPPSRTALTLTHDDNAVGGTLGLSGGDLTVTGVMTLTNGVLLTGSSKIINNGSAARTNGFIDGNLERSYTAAGSYTYHVGQNAYSPVVANVTALGTNPSSLLVRAVDAPMIGLIQSQSLSRYWNLTETGDLTADISFTYAADAADVNGIETDYRIFKNVGGVITNMCMGGPCVNDATNTLGPLVGVTDFSAWSAGENGAVDTVAPNTTIDSNPTDPTTSTDATFTFSGTDSILAIGGFQCKLDAGAFAACTSPQNYTGLALGSHTFEVRAVDTAGNVDPTPASFTWTITAGSTGPVTVTATTGTTGPTDYPTLKDAFDAVNAGTHTGVVTVSIVTNTTETAPAVLNSSGAGSASYTSLTVRPTADNVTIAGPTVTGRGLIELNGADNVTIDGDNPGSAGTNRNLTVQNTAANTVTFTSAVRIALAATVVNSANDVTIKNLNLLGSATGRNISTATSTTASENTTFGVFVGLGGSTVSETTAPAAVTSVSTSVGAGATANNLLINNNRINTAGRGVSLNGSATSVFPGLQITGNSIGNATAGNADQVYSVGITAQGSANGLIANNTVWIEGFIGSSTATHGIDVGVNSATGTFTIDSNKVNRVRNLNPATWSAYGINLGGGLNHVVQNNFVSGMMNDQTAGTGGFGTTFGAYGIRVGGGTGHKVYHNSVHLYGALGGTVSTDLTAAFMVVATTQTGLDVRNNIFSNQITGGNPTGTRHVSIYLPSAATVAMNLINNNNAYFAGTDALSRMAQTGATFGLGEYLAANFDPTATTPATNFRAYTSTLSAAGTNDNASFASTSPPPFTSNVDLHIPAATQTRLESGGAAVGVTNDIDVETRNATTPDIGADEFAGLPPAANDMAATVLVTPANGAVLPVGAIFSPQATFSNNGTATQTNVTVRYRIIDASMAVVYDQTQLIASIAPLQNSTVTFPSTTLPGPGAFTIRALAELAGDANTANDVISGTVTGVAPIGGSVNVGTGETYTSLTNAGGLFEALNTAGISSNIVINVTSDLAGETGAVMLNQLAEAGMGGYTVTIKPSGAARTISGTALASRGLINLNGADRIIIDGSLAGGTDRSLTITNNQTGTSTVIWIRAASAANGSNNNTIKNCIINGAVGAIATTTAGILTGSGVTIGGDSEAANNDNTIQNNWIYRVQNSAYIRGGATAPVFDQNWVVTGNEFGSTASTADKNIFRGMLIGNSQNFTVSNNLVHGVQSSGTTTASMSGIQIGLLVNGGTVTKNVISDIKNISASGTGANAISFISTSTASNVTVANNFISDVAALGSATLASNGFGINVASGAGYKIYYNSVNLNTNQGSGTTAAMLVQAAVTTAGGLDVQDNIFANTQTAGATRYAFYSGAAATVYTPINYNDYFSTGSVGFLGSARATLADWQTATGQDVNSAAVDPLFVSATDLHLQAASPVANLGTPIAGITDDIDGNPRSVTTPEMGADELPVVATPGSLQFSSATYAVGEAGPTATITVTRTGGSDGVVGASYATSNGTATGGAACGGAVDYVNTSGTVSFGNGVTTPQTFTIPICDDASVEGPETVNVTLSTPTGGATIGSPSAAVLTINDNDATAGSYSINDVRVVEGNSGPVNAVFTVTYTAGGASAVNFGTANRTASAGTDYTTNSGTLNFPASGSTQTQSVTVVISGDTVKEANETFFVNLTGATGGATITDNQGVGVIVDEDRAYVSDFDRDLKSDFSVARGSESRWYVLPSNSGVPSVVTFGAVGDRPTPGDYDGDGKTDMAFYRPSTSTWYILNSATSTTSAFVVGAVGDKPVQGDYNGDGRTDPATYRPTGGLWSVFFIQTGTSTFQSFGISTDRPVQGDYDGDAKTDLAVYRDGTWYVLYSSNSSVGIVTWGNTTDKPVSGDFDGDGQFDFAVYRNGQWWVLNSLSGSSSVIAWGIATDIAVPADYDGDGTTDVAIFRPSDGDWYVLRSSTLTIQGLHWGLNGDFPIPAGHLPQ